MPPPKFQSTGAAAFKWKELKEVKGAPKLLSVEAFSATCAPFIQWLSQPPITQSEAMVKARRIRHASQILPIQNNLRFLLVTLHEQQCGQSSAVAAAAEPNTEGQPPALDAFSRLEVCQGLFDSLTKRKVGSGRVHALFLLVKKVLVYLSSVASLKTKQYIAPVTFPSFFYVDSICADASLQRKQETRNRALLGMQSSPFHGSSSASGSRPPTPPSAMQQHQFKAAASLKNQNKNASTSRGLVSSSSSSAAAAAASASSYSAPPSSSSNGVLQMSSLSKQELQQLASGCLSVLGKCRDQLQQSSTPLSSAALCKRYVQFLVTATFALGLAPRSQVLRELRVGSTFIKDKEQYWVKMLAELNKNGKPSMMVFPVELTEPYDFYFETVRPFLLKAASAAATKSNKSGAGRDVVIQHDYVFFKRDGHGPRPEFSSFTASVTMELLGRSINAHTFRSAVITTFYENGATQGEMDVLANLMAHDSTTAKNHYFRPQYARAAVQANSQMTQLLLQQLQPLPRQKASRPVFMTAGAAPATMMDIDE